MHALMFHIHRFNAGADVMLGCIDGIAGSRRQARHRSLRPALCLLLVCSVRDF
jgi:hypothetical protein